MPLAVQAGRDAVSSRAVSGTDIFWMGLTDLVTMIARREISSVEITRAMLARIEAINGTLHAYLTVAPERALAAAARADAALARGEPPGPLHGVPIAVKDLCATRGLRTTCGSQVLADWIPDHDATVVAKLEGAGAVLLGKLNMTEFALTGYHPAWPRPCNPWDRSRDTGGSSSGAGAATAAGLCFASIGTDTGGSIRFPSGWCGVVGLKPTYGRVSRFGVFPLAASLDHVGPIARRVADVATMLDVMAGPDAHDPTALRDLPPACRAATSTDLHGLRIGWDEAFVSGGAQPDVAAAVRTATRALAAHGAEIREVHLPPCEALLADWPVLCAAEAAVAHRATFPARAGEYGPSFRSFLEYARTLHATDYAAGHERRLVWAGALRGIFETIDLLACPSTFMTAPPLALVDSVAPFTPDLAPLLRFSGPFDCSGNPTLSLPCGFAADGLPYSLQLIARHGEEPLLCRAGLAYETATEWHRRHPAVA